MFNAHTPPRPSPCISYIVYIAPVCTDWFAALSVVSEHGDAACADCGFAATATATSYVRGDECD